MFDFAFRALALGLRFACPLLILATSSQKTLGEYYIFTSFFTLAAVSISLEIGTYFSAIYLNCKQVSGRKLIFSYFISTQLLISSALAIPFSVAYLLLYPTNPAFIFLLVALFISEACVNEVGRFFWNIGLSKRASRRDFARALAFTLAISSAVILNGDVVNLWSLVLMTAFNTAIAITELRRLGNGAIRRPSRRVASSHRLKSIIKNSGIQFIHLQILISQSFFERLVLEKTLGIGTVGTFALQTTMIQASSSLFLQPLIANTRRIIFSMRGQEGDEAYLNSLWLLVKIAFFCGIIAVFLHFTVPHVPFIHDKMSSLNAFTFAVSTLVAVSAVYSASVAPLFCRSGSSIGTNGLSLLSMSILFVPFILEDNGSGHIVWLSLAITCLIQIMLRVLNFIFEIYKSVKPRS